MTTELELFATPAIQIHLHIDAHDAGDVDAAVAAAYAAATRAETPEDALDARYADGLQQGTEHGRLEILDEIMTTTVVWLRRKAAQLVDDAEEERRRNAGATDPAMTAAQLERYLEGEHIRAAMARETADTIEQMLQDRHRELTAAVAQDRLAADIDAVVTDR